MDGRKFSSLCGRDWIGQANRFSLRGLAAADWGIGLEGYSSPQRGDPEQQRVQP